MTWPCDWIQQFSLCVLVFLFSLLRYPPLLVRGKLWDDQCPPVCLDYLVCLCTNPLLFILYLNRASGTPWWSTLNGIIKTHRRQVSGYNYIFGCNWLLFVFSPFFRYYRPCEVPETVYQLLVQDRNTEQGGDPMLIDCNDKTDKIDGWLTGNKISFLHDPVIKGRELFISDATDTYPVSLLRYCILSFLFLFSTFCINYRIYEEKENFTCTHSNSLGICRNIQWRTYFGRSTPCTFFLWMISVSLDCWIGFFILSSRKGDWLAFHSWFFKFFLLI